MIVTIWQWLSSNLGSVGAAMWHWFALNLTAAGAAIAFLFSFFQFLAVRKRESEQREFDKYHWLIERLVSPGEKGTFQDVQIAAVFELRHFPRYYECTERILPGLKAAWDPKQYPRLLAELELTLQYIRNRKKK